MITGVSRPQLAKSADKGASFMKYKNQKKKKKTLKLEL